MSFSAARRSGWCSAAMASFKADNLRLAFVDDGNTASRCVTNQSLVSPLGRCNPQCL